MKKILLIIATVFLAIPTLFAQTDIADARTFAQGSAVTVTGIVMNGSSLGVIRYIQDGTAGIPVYDPAVSITWNQGDEVTLTGEMTAFGGVIQIGTTSSATVNSVGNTLYAPQIGTPNNFWPTYESELVEIQDVVFDNEGRPFTVGIHEFTQASSGQAGYIYLRSDHPLLCTPIPYGTVNLSGISAAYNSDAQLLPRDASDLQQTSNIYIETAPKQSNISTDGFTVVWETNALATHGIRYGLTDALELGDVAAGTGSLEGMYTFSGLDPATAYYVQTYSTVAGETTESTIQVYMTASNSTGVIRPIFNNVVDYSVSSGTDALTYYGPELLQYFIDKIGAAQSTVDVMMYNNNRTDLTQALIDAHNRGVVVRYITDGDNLNSGLSNNPPPFFIYNIQVNAGLMHNKILIIDAESVNDSWVISGSSNWTTNGIGSDYNNVIEIQDQSLARAYAMEFDEMWGGSTPTPGIFAALAGENKEDNTPHLFNIGGVMVESYFSPSDFVSCEIERAIRSADSKIDFAVLSFTYNDLGAAIADEHLEGTVVRGFIESTSDQGTEYDFLLASNVNVMDHPPSPSMHHKYVIVDADAPSSDPLVVTGSHNWSTSAETRNDENTLIIHDESITNQYWQEFEARWANLVGITAVPSLEGFDIKTYPNPASSYVQLDMTLENMEDIQVEVFDVNGKPVQVFELVNISGTYLHKMEVSHLPTGSYFVAFTIDGLTKVKMIEVVR